MIVVHSDKKRAILFPHGGGGGAIHRNKLRKDSKQLENGEIKYFVVGQRFNKHAQNVFLRKFT